MKFDYPDDSIALHTDAYQLTMMQTYWQKGIANRHVVFEAFFRKMPFGNGYAVFAGLRTLCIFQILILNTSSRRSSLIPNLLNICVALDLRERCAVRLKVIWYIVMNRSFKLRARFWNASW